MSDVIQKLLGNIRPGEKPFKADHVKLLASKLCRNFSKQFPHLIDPNDQLMLGHWIINSFSKQDIEEAHREICNFYEQRNSKRNRGRQFTTYTSPYANPGQTENMIKVINAADVTPIDKNHDQVLPAKPIPGNDFDPDDYVLRTNYDVDLREIKTAFKAALDNAQAKTKAISDLQAEIYHLKQEIKNNKTTVVSLEQVNMPTINVGVAHKAFPDLLRACHARTRSGHHLNIWLHGPAGTGKTTAAEKVAEILFGDDTQLYISNKETRENFAAQYNQEWDAYNYNGSLATSFQAIGYMDANGKYVITPFRKAWEFGGVYLFDEIDGSMPDALLALNGALANSIASFPDKMVPRHKDCIIIAGANTTGLGGNIEYVGAMKQNAAFLDRWEMIDWPHDDGLEDALCANKDWIARVRHVRNNIKKYQIKGHLITMRATLSGEALLAAGFPQEKVEDMRLRRGLSDDNWNKVSG